MAGLSLFSTLPPALVLSSSPSVLLSDVDSPAMPTRPHSFASRPMTKGLSGILSKGRPSPRDILEQSFASTAGMTRNSSLEILRLNDGLWCNGDNRGGSSRSTRQSTVRLSERCAVFVHNGRLEIPKAWSCVIASSLRSYARSNLAARVVAVEAADPPQELVVDELILAANGEGIEREPLLAEGGGGPGQEGGNSGGGGGGGGGDDEGDEAEEAKTSMSQTLTLIYAFLVGIGGLIGFAKSGSVKSLLTGSGAALALCFVYAQLPLNPTMASSFGLGISAVLLGVMYPRFKKSRKFMPAGLVALVSLIMTGGYLHGIVRIAR